MNLRSNLHGVYHVLSHKRKLDLLPSVEVICKELEHEKIIIKKFQKYHKKIVSISLDQGGSKLSKRDEHDKATWLSRLQI